MLLRLSLLIAVCDVAGIACAAACISRHRGFTIEQAWARLRCRRRTRGYQQPSGAKYFIARILISMASDMAGGRVV